MNAEEHFISISGLLCEPARARMLWNLLDGRAYTAGELAIAADISPTSASNHLAKLREGGIVKVEIQGRHRYYALANAEIAYVAEAMANLAGNNSSKRPINTIEAKGIRYCRTCYDHLAGYTGVKITEAMEQKGYLKKSNAFYEVTKQGWDRFTVLDILPTQFTNSRRPLARQCLDWSERRPHLAGQLGAAMLEEMINRKWFRKVQFSRELTITSKGKQELYSVFGIEVK